MKGRSLRARPEIDKNRRAQIMSLEEYQDIIKDSTVTEKVGKKQFLGTFIFETPGKKIGIYGTGIMYVGASPHFGFDASTLEGWKQAFEEVKRMIELWKKRKTEHDRLFSSLISQEKLDKIIDNVNTKTIEKDGFKVVKHTSGFNFMRTIYYVDTIEKRIEKIEMNVELFQSKHRSGDYYSVASSRCFVPWKLGGGFSSDNIKAENVEDWNNIIKYVHKQWLRILKFHRENNQVILSTEESDAGITDFDVYMRYKESGLKLNEFKEKFRGMISIKKFGI